MRAAMSFAIWVSGLAWLSILAACEAPAGAEAFSVTSDVEISPPREATTSVTEPSRIDVPWMVGEEAAALTALPELTWCRDGRALLLDPRRPASERTLERLDPTTGERTPAVDASAALRSLKALVDGDIGETLEWPIDFSADGKRAAYRFGGDLFVLDLEASRFRRVTSTRAEEKSPRFSPDGRFVAFVRDQDLYSFDLFESVEHRLTRDGSETLLNGTLSWVYWEEIFGRRDIGYWWSPDSRSIVFLQTDESEVGIAYFLDPEPVWPRLIEQRYPKAGTTNPSVRLGVVGADGDHRHWIDLSAVPHEYVVRVQWLPDGQRLAVQTMTRDQQRLDLSWVDPVSSEITPILHETDPAWINIHDDLVFLDGGREFLWSSERTGYTHLYRYSDRGELRAALTQGNWSVRSSAGAFWVSQSIAAVDEARGWVLFTGQADSSIERHLYRVRLDGSERQRLTRNAGTHRITARPDGAYFVDAWSDLSTPPRMELCAGDGRLLRELSPPRVDLAQDLGLVYPELFTIEARDGFEMPACLMKPADYDPSRSYPLILDIYGGPSAPNVANAWSGWSLWDQILVGDGFLVLRVDNRSATAISKTLESTVLGQLNGDGELNDLVDAVRHMKARPDVDAERVGVWGWSGGGSFTLLAMTQSEEFRAGIAVAPVTDWHYYDTKWAEFAMKRPEENVEGYERTNLNRFAGDLHGRLLLVHGTYDDNVHPQSSWRFIEALVQANKRFEMMFYPMRKHGISDRPARIHLYSTMLEFWRRELGTSGARRLEPLAAGR